MECFRFSSSLPEIDVNERLQHVCNIVTNGGKYLTEFLAKFGSKWDHFLLFDLFGEWKTFNMTCVCDGISCRRVDKQRQERRQLRNVTRALETSTSEVGLVVGLLLLKC